MDSKDRDLFQPVIVPNLDTQLVTWAPAYCQTGQSVGLEVTATPGAQQDKRIFIGDEIPSTLLADAKVAVYLLAAFEGLAVEEENIHNTDLTLVASSAEIAKIQTNFRGVDTQKLFIAGFPLETEILEKYHKPWEQKIPKSVCFLGETRDIKNPPFELEIVRKLQELGYQCFHLSPRGVSISDKLKALGCIVIEGIKGEDYYKTASQFQYVVNTSYSESLYISGIEASIMGAIPILPKQESSGFSDWCPPSLMYEYPSVEAAIDLIKRIDGFVAPDISYSQYDQKNYFKKVVREIEACR